MPKFTVILTRDTTESAIITVEADDAEMAADAALTKAEAGGAVWEADCNYPEPSYVTDVSEAGA